MSQRCACGLCEDDERLYNGPLGGSMVPPLHAVVIRYNPLIPPGYAVFTDRKGNIVGIIKPEEEP